MPKNSWHGVAEIVPYCSNQKERQLTRSSATAQGPREAICQSKYHVNCYPTLRKKIHLKGLAVGE